MNAAIGIALILSLGVGVGLGIFAHAWSVRDARKRGGLVPGTFGLVSVTEDGRLEVVEPAPDTPLGVVESVSEDGKRAEVDLSRTERDLDFARKWELGVDSPPMDSTERSGEFFGGFGRASEEAQAAAVNGAGFGRELQGDQSFRVPERRVVLSPHRRAGWAYHSEHIGRRARVDVACLICRLLGQIAEEGLNGSTAGELRIMLEEWQTYGRDRPASSSAGAPPDQGEDALPA